ncbi:MAG: hypothetical protein HQ517_16930 [SAR324 cluster bacterium]|nr:hypothetical protein [SAR324 cluster bacterium]
MGEEASFMKNDKFLRVEERMKHILNKDEGVSTTYSELRNLYSGLGNDIKGAITKRLSKLMSDVLKFNTTYIKGKTPKKDQVLSLIEQDFNQHLKKAPDINSGNTKEIFQFLKELSPLFIQIKAYNAKAVKNEKKVKKVHQLESQLHIADLLSLDIYSIYNALLHYAYFDQYAQSLIRSKVSKDSIKEVINDIHTVIKKSVKTGKNEVLDIRNLKVIGLMALRIKIRLGVYEACELFPNYEKILKSLPRQLVQQFNRRYFALRRESAKNVEELKNSDEYKGMTKKFITLKLKKFYNLLRLFQINVNRLFIIDDQIQADFSGFIEKLDELVPLNEKTASLEALQESLNDGVNKYLMISTGLPKNEDLKRNSIKTLFSLLLSFYYNILKDTYTPLTCREIAVRTMKLIKPSKEQMLNSHELEFLESDIYKRDEKILNLFFQGIICLITGEEEEKAVVEPVMAVLEIDYRSGKKIDMHDKTVNGFIKAICPAELDLLAQTFDIIPHDQERIASELGKLYLETVEKYPANLKQKVNRLEKVEPTDSEKEKLRKIVTDKYDRLLLKTTEFQSDTPSTLETLKKAREEEQAFRKAELELEEMHANYNISSLIAHWKSETDKIVISMCLGSSEKAHPAEQFREFNRSEISTIKNYFTAEHLGEIEKHYKTLAENVGEDYLKATKHYSKFEYIILYLAKSILVEYRNPAKSYPRVHQRLGATSAAKKT